MEERGDTFDLSLLHYKRATDLVSLSLYGVESDAVPLSTPPRGLENFRCVDWICSDFLLYLFSGFVGFRLWIISVFTSCLLSLHLFGFLQHIFSLSARYHCCICYGFPYVFLNWYRF